MSVKSIISVCLFALIAFFGALMYMSPPIPVVAQGNALENRVKALETAQAALLKRVSVLETTVATKTVVLVPTPTVAPVASSYEYELVSIDDKMTATNAVYDTRSWLMVIKNNTSKTLTFNATIKYFDAQGFVVHEEPKFGLFIGPNETKEFTGQALIELGPSDTIVKIGVDSNITQRR